MFPRAACMRASAAHAAPPLEEGPLALRRSQGRGRDNPKCLEPPPKVYTARYEDVAPVEDAHVLSIADGAAIAAAKLRRTVDRADAEFICTWVELDLADCPPLRGEASGSAIRQ